MYKIMYTLAGWKQGWQELDSNQYTLECGSIELGILYKRFPNYIFTLQLVEEKQA